MSLGSSTVRLASPRAGSEAWEEDSMGSPPPQAKATPPAPNPKDLNPPWPHLPMNVSLLPDTGRLAFLILLSLAEGHDIAPRDCLRPAELPVLTPPHLEHRKTGVPSGDCLARRTLWVG